MNIDEEKAVVVTSDCSLDIDEKETKESSTQKWFWDLQEKQKLRLEMKIPETLEELKQYLGKRVILEDESLAKGYLLGTVRYVGPVATAKSQETLWVGIEWDTDERGKHDGEVETEDGKTFRYFKCMPKHGSFLRPKKLTWPQDLLSVILTMYNVNDLKDVIKEQDSIAESSDYRFEFVGWTKHTRRQYDLSNMKYISLNYRPVGWVDRVPDLRAVCPVLQELDLAVTTIQSFGSLSLVDEAFPNLRVLNISHNRFNDIPDPKEFSGRFSKLKKLILANIPTGFSVLMNLLKVGCFTNLREVVLTYCDIVDWQKSNEKDTDFGDFFPLLEIITIGNSGLTWDNIWPFRRCKSLKTLNIQFNPITNLRCEEGDFPALQDMTLANTKLPLDNLYGAISLARALRNFQNLKGVEIGQTPLDDDPMARHILLSECPQLTSINRSRFRRRERLDCNMEYIKWCTIETDTKYPDLLDQPDGEKVFLQRLFEIFPQAKEVAPKEGISIKYYLKNRRTKESAGCISTISVKLISLDEKSCTKPAKTKKVPVSMKVATLKILFKRHFKRPVEEQVLAFRKPGMDIPLRLEDDNKTIQDYRMFDGAEVLMYNKATF